LLQNTNEESSLRKAEGESMTSSSTGRGTGDRERRAGKLEGVLLISNKQTRGSYLVLARLQKIGNRQMKIASSIILGT